MIGAQLDVTTVADIPEKKLLLVQVKRKSYKASYLPNRYLQWGKSNKKFTNIIYKNIPYTKSNYQFVKVVLCPIFRELYIYLLRALLHCLMILIILLLNLKCGDYSINNL